MKPMKKWRQSVHILIGRNFGKYSTSVFQSSLRIQINISIDKNISEPPY